MKVVKQLSLIGVLLFAVNAFANPEPSDTVKDRNLWLGVKVGSAFHNSVLEADRKEVDGLGAQEPLILGIRKAQTELNLKPGDYFEVNLDTGAIRELQSFSPDNDALRELKATGVFFIDVAKDSVVVIPLDVLKDLYESVTPLETSEDKYLSELDILSKQGRNICTDLRTALGVDHHGLNNTGITKIVVSSMKLSPSGVLEGTWDVGVGIVGAAEDTAFTTCRIVRRGVVSFVRAVKKLFDW